MRGGPKALEASLPRSHQPQRRLGRVTIVRSYALNNFRLTATRRVLGAGERQPRQHGELSDARREIEGTIAALPHTESHFDRTQSFG